jgi:phenylacetate-CoA ligase
MDSLAQLLFDSNSRLPDFDIIQSLFNRLKDTPLYKSSFKNRDLSTWNDFIKLPLTSKEMLRNIRPSDNLIIDKEDVWHYHESFGTTGTPISSWYSRQDYKNEIRITEHWTSCIKPGMKVLNRFPYSFAIPPFVLEEKCRMDGGIVLPVGYLSWNMPYARVLDIMKRLEVEAIGCLPTEMIILEMVARHMNYDIRRDFKSLNHILTSGRIVPDSLKNYIEEKWDAKMSTVYGCTECGGVASSCENGNLHIHRDAHIVEILDENTLMPVRKGEAGMVVLTSYYRQASPMIRYNTGDYARISLKTCGCGNPDPVIEVLGRADEAIRSGNANIYFLNAENAVMDFSRQFDSPVYYLIVDGRRIVLRLETHNLCRKYSRESYEKLSDAFSSKIKVDICNPGDLLDIDFLLRAPEVYKPKNITFWDREDRKTISMTEGLIKFPEYSFADFVSLSRKSIKNMLVKKGLIHHFKPVS